MGWKAGLGCWRGEERGGFEVYFTGREPGLALAPVPPRPLPPKPCWEQRERYGLPWPLGHPAEPPPLPALSSFPSVLALKPYLALWKAVTLCRPHFHASPPTLQGS